MLGGHNATVTCQPGGWSAEFGRSAPATRLLEPVGGRNDDIGDRCWARTPIGRLMGSLKDFSGTDLGAIAIRGALEKAGVPASMVST